MLSGIQTVSIASSYFPRGIPIDVLYSVKQRMLSLYNIEDTYRVEDMFSKNFSNVRVLIYGHPNGSTHYKVYDFQAFDSLILKYSR